MKMSSLQWLLACAVLACTPAYAADVAAGKAKAEEVCADCHGDDGRGDDESPDIVKLSSKEFFEGMNDYRSGARTKNAKMARAAKKLTPEDVANLAAYYETLK